MALQKFAFDIEVEVFQKAGPGEQDWRIGGIVSTDGLDRQGERLIQEGLDFSPFLKGGWFNDNHQSDTASAVGYPTAAELRTLPDGRKGWYVEGYLLKGYEPAKKLWELANALQKSDRRLGFSVEGSILERDVTDPKTVRKAVVREVAITRCPVNTDTTLSVLAKSLAAGHSAPTGEPGDGAPLKPQSIEADTNPPPDKKRKRKKRMTKSEAVDLMCELQPRLSRRVAETIVNFAMRSQAA
jgi:hypothetical protein